MWHFCHSGWWIPAEAGDLICEIDSGGEVCKNVGFNPILSDVLGAVKLEGAIMATLTVVFSVAINAFLSTKKLHSFETKKVWLRIPQKGATAKRQSKHSRHKKQQIEITKSLRAWICSGKTHTAAIRSCAQVHTTWKTATATHWKSQNGTVERWIKQGKQRRAELRWCEFWLGNHHYGIATNVVECVDITLSDLFWKKVIFQLNFKNI